MLQVTLESMTVPSGDTGSNPLGKRDLRYLAGLTIFPPAVLDTGTWGIEVSADDGKSANPEWTALQSGGEDVTLEAGKSLTLAPTPFKGIRIAGPTAATDRVFRIVGQEQSN